MRIRFLVIVIAALLLNPPFAAAQGLPVAKCDTLKALDAKFGHLNKGSDADRRRFALIAAQQFRFNWPDEGWGSKSTAPGSEQTKDVVARRQGTVFEGWDVVNGATRAVTCSGEHHNLAGQHFIEINAFDHLHDGGTLPPVEFVTKEDLQKALILIAELRLEMLTEIKNLPDTHGVDEATVDRLISTAIERLTVDVERNRGILGHTHPAKLKR